jgi:hypothetical protein
MGIKGNEEIFPNGVVYKGVFDNKPQYYRGETGAQGYSGLDGATGVQGDRGFYGKGTFTLISNSLNNLNTIEILDASTIMKTGLKDGWNSSVYSLEAYKKVNMSFTLGTRNSNIFAGLSINPSVNTYTSNIDYGFYLNESGIIQIYESNILVDVSTGTFDTNL